MVKRIILFSTVWIIALLLSSFKPRFEAKPLVSPLLLDKTREEIAADLRDFVPERMRSHSVPGVSISVVREGKVIYSEGFGVADMFTREPVTPSTVFEVASISKPVAAYAALQMVEKGELSLDTPLASYLKEPYVEDRAGESITLRQALTHTAGLTNQLNRKPSVVRPPGQAFSYSGQGFVYAGKAVEAVSGQPLDTYIESAVLERLGMNHSGYSQPGLSARMASPHDSVITPLLLFIVPALVAYLVLSLPAWLIARWKGIEDPDRRWKFAILLLCIALGLALPFLRGSPNAIRYASVNLVFVLWCAMMWRLYPGMRRLKKGSDHSAAPRHRRLRLGILALCVLPLLFVLIRRPPIPLERGPSEFPAAAGLRSTSSDIAMFLAELMEPRHAGKDTMREMLAAQTDVNERNAWGLGIGIQKGDHTTAIWHWGINFPGFQALMVAYPEQKIGIVVLANGGPISMTRGEFRYAGLEMAREIAFRAIGGEHYGYWHGVQ